MVKESAPGRTAFNSASGIGPPCFVLGAQPALSAVGVGAPFPVPPSVPSSEARHPAGLSRTALYLFMGSEGHVAIHHQPGVAHILEHTGRVGGKLPEQVTGCTEATPERGGVTGAIHRLHSTVVPFEFFYEKRAYYLCNYISRLAPPHQGCKNAKSTKHVLW